MCGKYICLLSNGCVPKVTHAVCNIINQGAIKAYYSYSDGTNLIVHMVGVSSGITTTLMVVEEEASYH